MSDHDDEIDSRKSKRLRHTTSNVHEEFSNVNYSDDDERTLAVQDLFRARLGNWGNWISVAGLAF